MIPKEPKECSHIIVYVICIISYLFPSGCSTGQYWDVEEGEELGSGGPAGECVNCAVAKYQDETHHRETECKNCSGIENTVEQSYFF